MTLSLYQKLSISLLLTFVVIVIAFLGVSQRIETLSKDKAEQQLHRQLAEHLVNDNPLLASGKFDSQALKNLFHSMMILGQNFEYYVLDTQGKILNYSASPGVEIREKIDLTPIKLYLKNDQPFPIYAQDPRSAGEKIFSASPIIQAEELKGYLYVIVRSQMYDSIFQQISASGKMQVYGLVVLASIVFLFAILLVSFRFIVAPLRHLTAEVNLLERADNSQPLVPIVSQGRSKEVDALTISFNRMIIQINGQFERLKQVDTERRELLSHLSHDLRTPLASLQGFLETIAINHQDLSEKDKQAYLSRCLKNARQLKHLVDQIFELAHLESGQVSTTLELLPIAELLYDLVDKFSLKGRDNSISL